MKKVANTNLIKLLEKDMYYRYTYRGERGLLFDYNFVHSKKALKKQLILYVNEPRSKNER